MVAKATIPEAIKKKEREIDILYGKTFGTPTGKKVLAHLISTTIDKPVMQVSEGFSGIMIGYSREGQNALVRSIQKRIVNANASRV